jgi:hypothetical protein
MYKNRRHPTKVECRLFCPILSDRCRFRNFLKLLSYRHTPEQLLFFLLPYSSKTSPSERTALRTHSGQGHRTLPVPMPFRSLQMVAPHLRSKFCTSSLEIRGVPLPSVRMPATMTAPIKAPQVLSIHPIPAAYPAVSFISVSSSIGSLSSNTLTTDCVQLHFPVAFSSAAAAARSSILVFHTPFFHYTTKEQMLRTSIPAMSTIQPVVVYLIGLPNSILFAHIATYGCICYTNNNR